MIKIHYECELDKEWLNKLSLGNPEKLFFETERAVTHFLRAPSQLDGCTIKIMPCVHYHDGKPIYSQPYPWDNGRGWFLYSLPPIIKLGVGKEFILTTIHEFIHLISPRDLASSSGDWRTERKENDIRVEELTQKIALWWALSANLPFNFRILRDKINYEVLR